MRSFRSPEACRLARITMRQLDYWDRIGVVCPSVHEAKSAGDYRLYSELDLVLLEAIGTFSRDGGARQVRYLGKVGNDSLVEAVRRSGYLRGWAVGRGQDWAIARTPEFALKLAQAVGGPVWILRLGDVLDRLEAEAVPA